MSDGLLRYAFGTETRDDMLARLGASSLSLGTWRLFYVTLKDIASHGCLEHAAEGFSCFESTDGEPECEVCMAALALREPAIAALLDATPEDQTHG